MSPEEDPRDEISEEEYYRGMTDADDARPIEEIRAELEARHFGPVLCQHAAAEVILLDLPQLPRWELTG